MADSRVTLSGRLARLGFSVEAAVRDWACVECPNETLLGELAQAADPDLALRSLARLVQVVAASEHGDAPFDSTGLQGCGTGEGDHAEVASLRSALCEHSAVAHRLALVLGASSALGDHLIRHPDDWRELADPALDLTRPTAAGIAAMLAQATDADDLRRHYRRLLLRLAARDLGLELRLEDAAGELADLAAGAIEAALLLTQEQLGEPAQLCRLAVIGLGKCGGRELNYVSDVDVIFVAEPVDGVPEHEALRSANLLAAAIMRMCSAHTGEGTLWPVDAGLRPEGNAGPLVRTLASHATYYQRWATTWEFQALLKARPIAGDGGLGDRYMQTIAPLAWSAADRPGFVADVQAMRRRVVDQLHSHDVERELKLGPGGLRDIEFAVQLLQLVHGRTDSSLRSPHTLSALAALTAGGYVGRDDGASLADSYRFLRTLEHRLQLSHLRRTHVLPADPRALRVLGRSVGLLTDSADELTRRWRRHALEVRRLHEKLFYRPLLGAVAALPGPDARLSADAARERMQALGYADSTAALRHLEALTAGVSRRAAIQRTLLPAMLGWFADAPDPDAGLLGFRQLSEALGSTHWYLAMLRDEGLAAGRLARLLATSRYATDLLMRAPEATSLLARDDDLRPRPLAALVHEAHQAVGRQDDPTQAIAAVRAIRRRELFRIAAADILGLLDGAERERALCVALTDVAGATLEGGFAAAVAAIEREQGAPLPTRLAVIAMGRLGGAEMSYTSDADVLFVHQPLPGADERAASEAAFAVANELVRLLSLPGSDPAVGLDTDLRPEGRQGPLVRTLASYRAYYQRWSKVWEAQALLRAAPVAGDAGVAAAFVELIDPLRYPDGGLSAADITEVRRVKARVDAERLPRGADPATHLKLGRGGLGDVEWTIQLLQLRHAHEHPELRTTQTLAALDAAVTAGLLLEHQARVLRKSWLMASEIRNAAMLVRGRSTDSLPTDARGRAGVAFLLGYRVEDSGRLANDYLRLARQARAAVDTVFWS
ncbi:MAG: bifunctional [glutamine synthetase] adenylyltransferase/[glutamine synthetase]-adenylyl-L-tyrosine phosphorylase [Nocardioidaceae bacterium]